MCKDHEHRYRIGITVGAKEKFDLVVNARSVTEAISKADGYVFEKYPGEPVNFSTHHMGYKTAEEAIEHRATLTPPKRFRCGTFKNGREDRYEGPFACCEACAALIKAGTHPDFRHGFDVPATDLHEEVEEERHEYDEVSCNEHPNTHTWCGCECNFCHKSIRVFAL